MAIGNRRARLLAGALLAAALTDSGALDPKKAENAVLVGWDGTGRKNVEELLKAGKLPNLRRLVDEGGMTATQVTSGATETKPGWTEILTGRNADVLGIEDNDAYRPIPKGFTIFEILKDRFKEKIAAIFVYGKVNNLGFRGPHEICINCFSRKPGDRTKTFYWDKARIKPDVETRCGLPMRWVPREGEPYFNAAKAVDLHKPSLGPAANVGKESLAALDRFHSSRFFAFFHFEDPDEFGHQYGEGSTEYEDGIILADRWLGTLVDKMKALGIYDRTAIFVTADHGMDEGRKSHHCAADTFLATNLKASLRKGDRKDVTPTILETLGVDPGGVAPKLDGRSLRISAN